MQIDPGDFPLFIALAMITPFVFYTAMRQIRWGRFKPHTVVRGVGIRWEKGATRQILPNGKSMDAEVLYTITCELNNRFSGQVTKYMPDLIRWLPANGKIKTDTVPNGVNTKGKKVAASITPYRKWGFGKLEKTYWEVQVVQTDTQERQAKWVIHEIAQHLVAVKQGDSLRNAGHTDSTLTDLQHIMEIKYVKAAH